MFSLCAEVRGLPPHKFSLYHKLLDMVSLLQFLTQNQKDCYEVDASCSSSVLLQINSEDGPYCDPSGCFLFQKGTIALQSQDSYPPLSGEGKANLEIVPSLCHATATGRRGLPTLLPALCTWLRNLELEVVILTGCNPP